MENLIIDVGAGYPLVINNSNLIVRQFSKGVYTLSGSMLNTAGNSWVAIDFFGARLDTGYFKKGHDYMLTCSALLPYSSSYELPRFGIFNNEDLSQYMIYTRATTGGGSSCKIEYQYIYTNFEDLISTSYNTLTLSLLVPSISQTIPANRYFFSVGLYDVTELKEMGYNSGYNVGYETGDGVGYDRGFEKGIIEGQQNQTLVSSKDIIQTCVEGFADVMQIEIFPKVPVGALVSVPVVLALGALIIKLIRG